MTPRSYCSSLLTGGLLLLLAACQTPPKGGEPEVSPKEKSSYDRVRAVTAQESEEFARHQDALRKDLEKTAAPLPTIQPVAPSYDPLADLPLSLSLDNVEPRHVLRALAEAIGVNLTMSPEAIQEDRKISLHFKETPANEVLAHVLKQADLHGELKGNLLVVDTMQEKILHLDFLETSAKSTFNVGGDVLGSSGTSDGTSSGEGLTGEFTIEGTGAENTNPYVTLEKMLGEVKSNDGKVVLNRLSGTLYIKDRPSVVTNVEVMVNRFITMMRRQILLEARILEVELNDAHQFGVDWSLFRQLRPNNHPGAMGTTNANLANVSNFLSNDSSTVNPTAVNQTLAGAVFNTPATNASSLGNFPMQALAFNKGWSAVLTLLQEFGDTKLLSNPSIRMRHAQPSMISVGLNNTYISKITTTTSSSSTTSGSLNVETGNVFDGLLLGVIPFIADDGRISLTIHPIQSNVVPGSLEAEEHGNATNSVQLAQPKVWLREISTSIEVRDGDTVVLGGLISKTKTDNKRGLPGVAGVPILGGLLGGNQSESMKVSELVIVLRISIL